MKKGSFSDKKIESLLKNIPKQITAVPSKDAVEDTVLKAKEIMIAKEKRNRMDFAEFLIVQMKMMRKKWWLLQGLLLLLACGWLSASGDADYIYQGLSIFATLFVILIIPELWKNMECKSMEIEASAFFDLRKVYAAKLIAFGLVDTIFITFFCIITTQLQNILFIDMLKQFVFPVIIAATICMTVFSCRNPFNELVTMIICIVANLIWMAITFNEMIYSKITPLIWMGVFAFCISLIFYNVRKVLNQNSKYREGEINGINFG